MYSSGGDLHLELPTGQQGGTGKLWVSGMVSVFCVKFYFDFDEQGRVTVTHAAFLPPGDSPF